MTFAFPCFRGYLSVRINRTERVQVLNVPGELTVVGGKGREPLALLDVSIDSRGTGLQERLRRGSRLRMHST